MVSYCSFPGIWFAKPKTFLRSELSGIRLVEHATGAAGLGGFLLARSCRLPTVMVFADSRSHLGLHTRARSGTEAYNGRRNGYWSPRKRQEIQAICQHYLWMSYCKTWRTQNAQTVQSHVDWQNDCV